MQQSIYADFAQKFAARAKKIIVGDPLDLQPQLAVRLDVRSRGLGDLHDLDVVGTDETSAEGEIDRLQPLRQRLRVVETIDADDEPP